MISIEYKKAIIVTNTTGLDHIYFDTDLPEYVSVQMSVPNKMGEYVVKTHFPQLSYEVINVKEGKLKKCVVTGQKV